MDARFAAACHNRHLSVSVSVSTSENCCVYKGTLRDEAVEIRVYSDLSAEQCAKAGSECERRVSIGREEGIAGVLTSFTFQTDKSWSFAIVTEWLDRTFDSEVRVRAKSSTPWTEDELSYISTRLILAFATLQDLAIAHRDPRPETLYIDADNQPIIGSFSCARVVSSPDMSIYTSPELRSASDVSARARVNPYKSDVYSLGATLLQCYSLRVDNGLRHTGEFQSEINTDIAKVKSARLQRLLRKMMNADLATRPDFTDLRVEIQAGMLDGEEPPAPRMIRMMQPGNVSQRSMVSIGLESNPPEEAVETMEGRKEKGWWKRVFSCFSG